ncbi:MAG: hypothetical protein AAGC68_01675 [Verrucomicrobiota bacterium]
MVALKNANSPSLRNRESCFRNVSENSVLGGTDTYIIPVSRYASASRIAIRQISGQLILYGLFSFPVLSENSPPMPKGNRSVGRS